MTIRTPGLVFRDYATDGVPSSGAHDPIKSEIRELLDRIDASSATGVAAFATKAEMDAVTDRVDYTPAFVWSDTTAANNGQYVWDDGGATWTKLRDLPDTIANVTLGGTANAQTGDVATGINPAGVLVYFAVVGTDNTGAMTLAIEGETPRDVVNAAGNALSAGEWTGTVQFFLNSGGDYQLINDAGAAAAAAASASDAAAAKTAAENARDAAIDARDDILASGNTSAVATRTDLKALAGATTLGVFLSEDGRSGQFEVAVGDYSTEVSDDSAGEGAFIPFDDTAATSKILRRTQVKDRVLDPRWWGVTCDGSDESTGINNMLAITRNGDTIMLPTDGLIGVGSTIVVDKQISFVGRDKQRSGLMGLGLSSDTPIIDYQGTTGARLQNCRLQNFTLRSDNALARGLGLTWVNLSDIRDIYFYNLYRGLTADYAWSNRWVGLQGYTITQDMMLFLEECNNALIDSCRLVGANGLRVIGNTGNLTIVNPDVEGITSTSGAGIYLAPTTGKTVDGVSITGGYGETIKGYYLACYGVDANSVRGLIVQGNYIYGGHANKFSSTAGQAQHGIILTKVDGFRISENLFRDWESNCVYNNSTGINGVIENNPIVSGSVPAITNSIPGSVRVQNNGLGRKVEGRTSVPTSGSYTAGDYVENTGAAVIDTSNMVLTGWRRMTTGSGHTVGTDWARCYSSHVTPAV